MDSCGFAAVSPEMPTNFGPRNASQHAETPPSGTVPVNPARPETSLDFTIATSRLVVVRAITAALRRRSEGLHSALMPSFVEMSWGDGLIDAVSDGSLDMCIYNEPRGLERMKSVSSVRHAGTLGYSMAGKNFAVLTSRTSRWANYRISDLRHVFENATVIVGRATDRFSNLLDVLGLPGDNGLQDRNITVIDTADSPCTLLKSMPDAIMIAGQNRRFESMRDPGLVELGGFDDIDDETRSRLRSRSANALFINDGFELKFGILAEDIRLELWSQVALQWSFEPEALLRVIADESEFDDLSISERLDATAEIIFATYRFGAPR